MTKVQFDAIDPRILPEMSAKVAFLSQEVTPEQQKAFTGVNQGALSTRDGKSVVFALRDDKAVEVPVSDRRSRSATSPRSPAASSPARRWC